MAGASLLTLIDDIATVLDDVAVMTKMAAKNTAGVLGDDLALNAQQVAGVRAEREIPVVWSVAVGSMKNKAILVPLALLLSSFMPFLITPLLMLGGAYLCFEGAEKVIHVLFHKKDAHHEEGHEGDSLKGESIEAFEKRKIKGAIRTDFILSAEIIIISLGTVATAPIGQRIAVLVAIALIMTVGVYGLVAGIVKMDDLGFHLMKEKEEGKELNLKQRIGQMLINAAAPLMKLLGIFGTVAMFTVGGGILVHGLPFAHHLLEHLEHSLHLHGVLHSLFGAGFNALGGILAGVLIVGLMSVLGRFIPALKH